MVLDLFYDTVRTCSDSEEETEMLVAQLLEKYQSGLLIFAIKWMKKRFPYSFTSLKQLEPYMEIIKIQYDVQQVKERQVRRNSEYDPKNKLEASGPPKWIRAGVDYDLFKRPDEDN